MPRSTGLVIDAVVGVKESFELNSQRCSDLKRIHHDQPLPVTRTTVAFAKYCRPNEVSGRRPPLVNVPPRVVI